MAADHGDPALDVLCMPFDTGALAWPQAGDALFLRARAGVALRTATRPGLICEQSFRPAADALERDGWTVRDASVDQDARYPLVLALPPRQRDEARALFARAVAQCAPGGTVVACMANDEGAKSGESDLTALCGLSGNLSKQHCRVFWSTPDPARIDADLLSRWAALDAPRTLMSGTDEAFVSRPGVFAWDRIDAASALLVSHLPDDLAGRAADLGAGWGYLSRALLRRCPGIVSLDLYEAESRALDLARTNLAEAQVPVDFHWHDVTTGLSQRYDVIVSNPPFHAQGRADRPDIGRAFIAAAADALNPRGRLWLVANRHLPYEQVLDARFASVRTVAQDNGFKIIEAIKQ